MGDIHAFIEMHIEQGNNLYSSNTDIGIVEGIVGLKWWDVTVEGFTNHAGTCLLYTSPSPRDTG